MNAASFSILFPLFFCGIGILAILGSVFWIWMIVDCATNEPRNTNDKIIWLLVIIFVHFVGALLYYLIRRPERIKLTGR
ncbi:MAG: PLDc_N domain-containing protein [Ktedonobacteraceae bacterium]|nr:PLDc_N domain-containing protein [Ktedonobacteraceae bacterium]